MDKILNEKENNVFLHSFKITQEKRAKLLNQKPFVLWITGLSASGKSTLANNLEEELYKSGFKTYTLDGDNLRDGLNSDLGFSKEDREENIRRVACLCHILVNAGLIVIASFISPFTKDREFVKSLFKNGEFIEIFLDTPLEVCEQRDIKGLYKKAKSLEIKEFTAVSSPYEKPTNPNIYLNSLELKSNCTKILKYLKDNEYLRV